MPSSSLLAHRIYARRRRWRKSAEFVWDQGATGVVETASFIESQPRHSRKVHWCDRPTSRLPACPTRRYHEYHAMRFFVLVTTLTLPALASEDFAGRLYPVLEKAQCRLCHNDNGVASTTRLQFPRSSATPEEIDRFGLRLRALVDRSHPEESLLLRKPTNRVPHTGGQRIAPGSA